MAITNKALNDEQRNAFTVAYRLFEQFHTMTGTTEDWMQFHAAAVEALNQCNNSPLSLRLVMAVTDALELQQKAREDAKQMAPEQTMMELDGQRVIA